MPTLQPFEVDPARLPAYLEALTRALEGTGPALLPYAAGTPAPVVGTTSAEDLPEGLALVMGTSGSTGHPKRALLTADNLIASADATHARLGGPGQWLLAMPAHHIAGTQVLVRSLRAASTPLLMNLDDGFTARTFAEAAAWMSPARRYTALVPTQLVRLLDDPDGTTALQRFDAILLGGAASSPTLLARAAAAGLRVLTTYGMSETAGGCVYDGRPLEGTTITLGVDGRIGLSGPTVAAGYLADPERTAASFEVAPDSRRTFWTDDIGELTGQQLRVLGRRDDLITTGGLKVAPRVVEDATTALPEIAEAVALGTPDDQWGQVVSLAVVPRGSTSGVQPPAVRPTLDQLRSALTSSLPSYALPRRLLVLDAIPTRGPGKPDRAALAQLPGWQNHP